MQGSILETAGIKTDVVLMLLGESENKQVNKYTKRIVGCDKCSEENKQSKDAKNTESCLDRSCLGVMCLRWWYLNREQKDVLDKDGTSSRSLLSTLLAVPL